MSDEFDVSVLARTMNAYASNLESLQPATGLILESARLVRNFHLSCSTSSQSLALLPRLITRLGKELAKLLEKVREAQGQDQLIAILTNLKDDHVIIEEVIKVSNRLPANPRSPIGPAVPVGLNQNGTFASYGSLLAIDAVVNHSPGNGN